jgi:hypothetical protein
MLKQLSTRKFNESSHMILEILYSYLIFNMFNLQDRAEFRRAIIQFICSNSPINGEYR